MQGLFQTDFQIQQPKYHISEIGLFPLKSEVGGKEGGEEEGEEYDHIQVGCTRITSNATASPFKGASEASLLTTAASCLSVHSAGNISHGQTGHRV